ncbi:hypothetical protein PC39_08359 [Salinisphaera sp. PC39]|uniref:capsule assembly Wzi family protein n=1 Tax=Salinisphaera sp. PC39 TaxID=1304156 RepID=UPI0033425C0C
MRFLKWNLRVLVFAASLGLGIGQAGAMTLAMPGDTGLRHDIQLLADAGLLRGPVTTWPLPWPQIAADLAGVDSDADRAPDVAAALARVRWQLRMRKRTTEARSGVYVRGGTEPQFLRGFKDTPRAEVEGGLYTEFISHGVAGRVELSYAHDPDDDKEVRPDGTWLGAVIGNWMIAGGWLDRYWGPAWQSGLIMSNNPRPRPGITFQRVTSEPFESGWLSWMGPWSLTTFLEKLETDRAVPDALLWGFRFSFRPLESLEIGLSRSAQFGGDGNDVDLGTIADVLTGQSNPTNPSLGSGEDINQLGGIDARWRLPWWNAAVYGELTGEDEKGGRPFKMMGQAGLELWGAIGDSGMGWRLVYERIDTKADVLGEGDFGIAYNNTVFRSGYRYRGRSIGHAADGDASLNSITGILRLSGAHTLRASLNEGELNRGDSSFNALTGPGREDLSSIDLGYAGQFGFGRIELGVGYTRRDPATDDNESDTHAWLGLSREFR